MTRDFSEDQHGIGDVRIAAGSPVGEASSHRAEMSSRVACRSIDPPIDNPTRGGFEANDDAASGGGRPWFVTVKLGISAVFGYLALCAFGVLD